MARPTKKGTSAAGVDLSAPSAPAEVVSVKELWSECRLKDGTTLRLRPIIAEVRRLRNKCNEAGEPIYVVKTAIVIASEIPRKLHKKPRKKVKKKA